LTFCFLCIKLLKEVEISAFECNTDTRSYGNFLYGKK
jgi:hypothetical protein